LLQVALGFREDAVGALVLEGEDHASIELFLRARLIELNTGLPHLMHHAADETNETNASRGAHKMKQMKQMKQMKKSRTTGATGAGGSTTMPVRRGKKKNTAQGTQGTQGTQGRNNAAAQKKHDQLVNTLESEIKALRNKLDNTLPPRQADTIARMSKGGQKTMENTANALGMDATSRRYGT
jgi:hypothetical protein